MDENLMQLLQLMNNSSKTIAGGSPFSKLFRKIYEDVMAVLEDKDFHYSDVLYFPDVITLILDNYMEIYPLWRGFY